MAYFAKDYLVDDARLFDEEVDIFNLTFFEAGTVFAIDEITDNCNNFNYLGNCKLINGVLIFTLREFPGLIVDILSSSNHTVTLARQIIHSLSSPQRKPALT